ncbi:MAG: hypothetical protein WD068_01475 [Candidatus Babeliales bacterium]
MNQVPLEQQLYDIYPVIYIPLWQQPIVYIPLIFFGLAVVGLLGYGLFWYWQKKDPMPPWQEAQKSLQELSARIDPAQYQQFYFDLTAIIKRYLGVLLGHDYSSKTDQEVVYSLEQVDFPAYLRETMKKLFMGAQTIKFANFQAAIDQMRHDIEAAMKLIQETIPQNIEQEKK